MASSPSFTSTPKAHQVQIATANTARDGSGTLGTGPSGVAAGTKVIELVVQATGTTTAGLISVFLSFDGGTTKRLYDEIPVTAVTTPSATLAAFRAVRKYENLILPDTSATIYYATEKAETFNVILMNADLT